MATFFGFALSDSMFSSSCEIIRRELDADEVKSFLATGRVVSCLNKSHMATIEAARSRFGLNPAIPVTPPKVSLGHGDAIIIMGVRGLGRLTDRHEYTTEEIDGASFTFALYSVHCPEETPGW